MDSDSEDLNEIDFNTYADLNSWSNDINEQSSSLHIIHVNICSVRKYFAQLLVLINNCVEALDVIILTEVDIKEELVSIYTIPGFQTHSNTRQLKKGGGIIMYIKKISSI